MPIPILGGAFGLAATALRPLVAPLVGAIVRGTAWLFRTKAGLWVATALAWVGLSWTSYRVLLQPAIDQLENFAAGGGAGGTGEYWLMARDWMGVMKFDVAMTMIVSSLVARRAMGAGRLFLTKRGVL